MHTLYSPYLSVLRVWMCVSCLMNAILNMLIFGLGAGTYVVGVGSDCTYSQSIICSYEGNTFICLFAKHKTCSKRTLKAFVGR